VAAKKGKRRKHVPQRTCVGCRKVQAKRSLIRVVRSPDGVKIDPDGKLAGRGAYLHDLHTCWQKGLDGRLAHALKTEISAEDMAVLKEYMHTLPTDSPEGPSS
jgi:predicted RNA-binding protein YlxR (DUF448 family)